MNDSKFDDYERKLWRELFKSILYRPYLGAVSASPRSADYLRFLGISADRIRLGYDALSLARIRRQAEAPPAPDGAPFEGRCFTIVARLIPKKNLAMALAAYALYRRASAQPRELRIAGSGELEAALRKTTDELGLAPFVHFEGFVSSTRVSQLLAGSLALILPSIEDQFGQVVIEAQAMGLPVILSDNCGARDRHVRSGVNGFVVEPDNPAGLAYFMSLLDCDEGLWRRMCAAAADSAKVGDVGNFVAAVESLVG